MNKRLMMIAGEASGDLHGSRLLRELRRQAPGDLSVYGLGGDGLRAEGLEEIADVSAISVMGLAEVARVYAKARKIFDAVVERVQADRPDVAILIDFPEFNLRLAPKLKALGVPVVYYVSPQVWAWRKGRVRSMARCIDRMLVFFPFEVDFYRGRVEVAHVGHPLVDEVPEIAQAWDGEQAFDDGAPRRLVLLPGSRSNEVRRLLPVMLEAARGLRGRMRNLEVVLVQASRLDASEVDQVVSTSGVEVRRVPEGERFEAIAGSHLALCASGTATLEVGLLRTPMIVVYRMGSIGYWLGKLVVKVPFISLVNLVLGRAVVPELIQGEARPERIVEEAESLLEGAERRQAMRSDLAGLRGALGEPGASARAAGEVLELLEARS